MVLGMLTCKEALKHLDDYVDRELSQQEMARVRRHLRICHECSRKFASEVNFVRDVRLKLDRLAVPPELMRRVSDRLSGSDDLGSADSG